jgi:hypothetical protein
VFRSTLRDALCGEAPHQPLVGPFVKACGSE